MTNNARIGGILSIVGGALGCLGSLFLVLLAILMGVFGGSGFWGDYYYDPNVPGNFFMIMAAIYGVCAVIGLVVSVLAIVGGVYGIRRKSFGMALAGSIMAILSFFPCGIAAIVFTIMGRQEFETAPPAVPTVPKV